MKKILIGLLLLLIVIFIFFKVSPYPSVWLVRYVFNKEAVEANKALQDLVPAGIESKLNIQYDPADKDAYLDAYFHKDSVRKRRLPVIVWTHGGGLISGNKDQLSNYCKMLAAEGYVVVSIDYTVAPERKYPTPLRQLNNALQFISENAGQLHIDNSFIVLAGDSGGSMISAQVANIITSKDYSRLTKIKAGILPSQLKGLLLYCGIYDVNHLKTEGEFGSFLKVVLWAYFGKKDIANDKYAQTASVTDYLTSAFPPSFISAGNADPLLPQSQLLVKKLTELNVKTETLFFSQKRQPPLKHEYQFNYNEAGKMAFEKSIKFLKQL